MMEEVQLKAKPEYVAPPPLYKTSKIDNKGNWKYPYTYTILQHVQQQLQTKDKYIRSKQEVYFIKRVQKERELHCGIIAI